jgi:hypothetical protein
MVVVAAAMEPAVASTADDANDLRFLFQAEAAAAEAAETLAGMKLS